MRRIWAVVEDKGKPPLAYFSSREKAEQYVAVLTERYALGSRLALHGKPLSPAAGDWRLGLGPTVVEHEVDASLDSLPGAWVVRVDESCRMIACSFSVRDRPNRGPSHYRAGIGAISECVGASPHLALDRARKAMISYLSRGVSWR